MTHHTVHNGSRITLVILIVAILIGVGAVGLYIVRSGPEPVGTRVINGKTYPVYENKNSNSKIFRYEPIPIND